MTNPETTTTPAPLELLDALLFVDHDSPEWPYMWGQLEDPEARCPVTGEVWQYMGSIRQGDSYVHEFRHRSHPSNGRRVLKHVPASDEQMERLREVARELAALQRPEAAVLAEVERSWSAMVEANR